MDRECTRGRQWLIRWDREILAPFVSSGVAVGSAPHCAYGRPTASGTTPATATASLASAVRVQADGGRSRAGRGDAVPRPRSAGFHAGGRVGGGVSFPALPWSGQCTGLVVQRCIGRGTVGMGAARAPRWSLVCHRAAALFYPCG